MKNACGKTRPKENPYEIWVSRDGTWKWLVRKKYQSPEGEAANPYARWFCTVITPGAPYGDTGDVYISEIKSQAVRVS